MARYHKPTADYVSPTPYQLGQRFFKDGRGIDQNPYLQSGENYPAFTRGWRNAESAELRRTQPHGA